MVALMFIEVSAFHTFKWAESLLDDRELCAGDGRAADLVRFIRSDETPHVEYLRTAISEVRDRTVRTTDGGSVPGQEFIARIWHGAMADSLGPRRAAFVETTNREIARSLEGLRDGDDVLEEFHTLAGSGMAASTPAHLRLAPPGAHA